MTEAPRQIVDMVVIGAGPAGLAAAATSAAAGLEVVLLDEQATAGGQIYRGLGRGVTVRQDILGSDYAAGAPLVEGLSHPRIRHLAGAVVWDVTRQRAVRFSRGGRGVEIRARELVLATGATERPMPFPGWTLPGVMTAGAAQIMLKSSGLVPEGPTVLAGSGPLLFLLAAQYLRAGVSISALVETTPAVNRIRALAGLPGALRGSDYLRRGLGLLRELRRSAIPHYRAARGLHARGEHAVEALAFRTSTGRAMTLPCATLLLHNGVVPDVQITRALGLEHLWDERQKCWRPRLDGAGQSALDGIAVAGDCGGIGGAQAAAHAGRLCALHAAGRLGSLSPGEVQRQTAPERRALDSHLRARPFLDSLYAPSPEFLVPPDETVVCRCEEITAGDIRHYVALGCRDVNEAKSYGRPGMGPCQGRLCGLTVAQVMAAARGVEPREVGYYRIRPPVRPVSLDEIATIDLPEGSDADVVA